MLSDDGNTGSTRKSHQEIQGDDKNRQQLEISIDIPSPGIMG